MIYALIIAAGVTLALLYKFSPTRKGFMIVCTLMLVVFSVSLLIHGRQVRQEQITRAQLEDLLERQKIFGDWYAAYQKDIDRLDRNWQLYHNILDGLKATDAQSFNAEAIYLRLKELEQESVDEQLKIHMLSPPPALDSDNRYLVEVVIKKTQRYVDAQTRTITLSAQAATPPVDLEILQARLQDIMIRESPEGLFTAQEISAIRAALND
ncbi:MAG: hypothetical protein IJG80_07800 [Selenomonadaceae bacterium]|nr:hypothetical protein [Selenomonadaceae bacterium]MBQ3727791.1 hypothetical protein [Selenomonadaceae bacterium]MBQ9497480.1 hypothetical protein [Selenomonadaceae bacterium]